MVHRFAPGLYARELTMPAGHVAIGHIHKTEHLNVMLKGRVTVLNPDGTTAELKAPLVFVGKAGQKIGFIHEETVWLNVFASDERDVEKLEGIFLEKNDVLDAHKKAEFLKANAAHETDRADFEKAVAELGYTPERVRQESEIEHDLIPMPYGTDCRFYVTDSPIEGRGVFATDNFAVSQIIGVANLDGKRTPLGRFTNHSANPNAIMFKTSDGKILLVAICKINGSRGGCLGDEITIDYRQAFAVARKEIQ